MGTHISMGILGQTGLHMHGRLTVQWGRGQDRAILGVLLAQPRKIITIPALIECAWTDDKPAPRNPGPTSHTYANRIRAALDASDANATLENTNGGYRLNTDPASIDYFVFTELSARAHQADRHGDHAEVCAHAEQAVALWRGEPLAEIHSEWARNWRQAVVFNEWLPLNTLLIDAYLALRQFDRALRRLDVLQREHHPNLALAQRRLQLLRLLDRGQDATDYYLATRRKFVLTGDNEAAEALRRYQDDLPGKETTPIAEPAFPPRWRRPKPPCQLPRDTNVIGRADALRRLDTLTGVRDGEPGRSAVIVTGPPGVGKTATVVHWAHRHADRFPAGVLFAELHGFSAAPPLTAADVVDGFLAALGYPTEHIISPAGRAEQLRALLAERPPLIVLDNVADTGQVNPLLGLFTEAVVLITSRRRLSGLGARNQVPTVTLSPLSTDLATDLLVRRIGGQAADEPDAVGALVARCGGLPLALNLISERAAHRPQATLMLLARNLSNETMFSLGEDGDAVTESLGSIFACSYQVLPADAQRLFRLLGLHPKPDISVHAAAALSADSVSNTRRGLDTLVGAHLLEQPGDADHYRPHDLLYSYAAHLAAQDPGRRAARQRMIDFYLHTANNAHAVVFPHRPLPPAPPAEGMAPLTFANEDEASRWLLRERANLIAATVEAKEQGFLEQAWRLPHATLDSLQRQGRYEDVGTTLSIAVTAAAECGNPGAEAATLNDLGKIELVRGNYTAASDCLRQALRLAERHDIRVGTVTSMLNIAHLERELRHLDRATALLGRARILARTLGDRGREAGIEQQLGETLHTAGKHVAAVGHYRHALSLHQQVEDLAGQIETHAALASLALDRRHHEAANAHACRAMSLAARHGDVTGQMRAHTVLARLQLTEHAYDRAIAEARAAITKAEQTRNPLGQAYALDLLAEAYQRTGEPQRAWDAWREAITLFTGRGHDHEAARALRRLSDTGLEPPVIPPARTEERAVEESTEPHPYPYPYPLK